MTCAWLALRWLRHSPRRSGSSAPPTAVWPVPGGGDAERRAPRARPPTTGGQTRTNDGVFVAQTTSGTTTRYVQDLAAPLSQVLSDGTASYVYGAERLAGVTGGVRTW